MDVIEDDCAVVDENWTTPIEEVTKPGGDPTVCQDGQTSCDPSPLVVSLSGQYTFTSAAEGVLFDIDADGDLDRVAWPAAHGDVAFVALDRNGNGRIDDGSELFGDHARLANGDRARNGFEVLAELDANADSVVDGKDPAWSELVLWFDRNHDGISLRAELWPIADSEVTGLETGYRWIGRRDRHANMFRYASRIHHLFGRRPYYDVFLRVE
ncbi:MAG TPA: hypothetical protein VHK90_11200 [Thermoanaerobaculia bacterium]|nr:hypothetical protein [Thermoanaerobaculia bacterium]